MPRRRLDEPSGRRPPPASERVRGEWRRRVEAEYRSAALAQHLTLWLIQIGASPDLVDAGLAIVADELLHARLSHGVLRAAGGGNEPVAIARDQLAYPRRAGEPLEHDVLRACVAGFCLHETVAVALFRGLRAETRVPAARRVLDRVLRDEVRHRDFGWSLLGWLLDGPLGAALAPLLCAELPALFAGVVDGYLATDLARETRLPEAERAWGLMPGRSYAAITRRTLERDWVPRFARVGCDARAAFRTARARARTRSAAPNEM